jgi:CNT family concentrative nucleoside transporter
MKKIWYLLLVFTAIIFIAGLASKSTPPASGIQTSAGPNLVAPGNNQFTSVEVVDTAVFKPVSILRGILGVGLILLIAWLFSANRKAILWRGVFTGLGIQLVLAAGILMVKPIQFLFESAGNLLVTVMDFSRTGARFLFGSLVEVDKFGSIFAFQVLPTIVFFSALTGLLFYLGVIQKIVQGMGWLLTRAFRISGAESLTVAGNIFLGQLEAPLLVKGYLNRMTRSEILLVMVAGMGTIAGGVMAVYIGFLGGNDPAQRFLFAKHLLTASVMAAPGAVVIARILYPQEEHIVVDPVEDRPSFGDNALDSIAKGAWQGLKVAAGVAAMLLVFLALIAMVNHVLGRVGDWTNFNPRLSDLTHGRYTSLSLQLLFGYLFSPLMWLIGICPQDMLIVGQLLGEKTVMNEFVGYMSLADLKNSGAFLEHRSIIMATYLLCGFANFASVGMQIGGLGQLAPSRRKWVSEFGMRALLGGSLVSLLSATIVGMIIG